MFQPNRRTILGGSLLLGLNMKSGFAMDSTTALQRACDVLEQSVASGQVRAACIVARVGTETKSQAFGTATINSSFLLGSISKPMAIAAVMKLVEQGHIELAAPAQKYLPEFRGDGREKISVQQLMTHVSGLPDQLPENASLRKSHSTLEQFAAAAMRVPLGFEPGTKYEYSSMAILLATEIARRISGRSILKLVEEYVTGPIGMQHSALGLGQLDRRDCVPVQTENAAPEAGGGDPTAKDWDWNSDYWRAFGAPWGGMHASAGDVMKFLDAMVKPPPGFLSPETARRMITDHNQQVRIPRGLGFAIGPITICPGVSQTCFGHSGSTGTLAWRDDERDRAFVVLTSLPGAAVKPHPRANSHRAA